MYWCDFRSIIDPTTPADPLLLGSEGFKSSDVTTFSSLELKFCIVVREPCKPSDVEGLQKKRDIYQQIKQMRQILSQVLRIAY